MLRLWPFGYVSTKNGFIFNTSTNSSLLWVNTSVISVNTTFLVLIKSLISSFLSCVRLLKQENLKINRGEIMLGAIIGDIAGSYYEVLEILERKNKAAIVVYFCSEGDCVWNVARNYNASVDEIMKINAVDSVLSAEKALLIPC